jgi:hypothetical protein
VWRAAMSLSANAFMLSVRRCTFAAIIRVASYAASKQESLGAELPRGAPCTCCCATQWQAALCQLAGSERLSEVPAPDVHMTWLQQHRGDQLAGVTCCRCCCCPEACTCVCGGVLVICT